MSQRFKARSRAVANPLPKRNRREALLRRTAAMIHSQAEFEAALSAFPKSTHARWFQEMCHYLPFKAHLPGAPPTEPAL